MDPHLILGVDPGASADEVARAYRGLAKRFHPDRRGGDAGRMAQINAAYELLRDGSQPPPPSSRPRGGRAGAWLAPKLRRALGPELVRVLEPHEEVLVVTDAVTWDSFEVRLAVSDRRLLWLRADAPSDRVRYLRWPAIERVEGRLRRPRRRVGELVVQPRAGRRVSFSELEPGALGLVLKSVRKHIPAA